MATAQTNQDRSAASAQSPYGRLLAELACRFTPGTTVDAQDLPTLTDSQLAIVINTDDYVALDAFNPGAYAEELDSAIHATRAEKALAFWNRLHRAVTKESLGKLARDLTDKLDEPGTKGDSPDILATEAWETHGDSVAFL